MSDQAVKVGEIIIEHLIGLDGKAYRTLAECADDLDRSVKVLRDTIRVVGVRTFVSKTAELLSRSFADTDWDMVSKHAVRASAEYDEWEDELHLVIVLLTGVEVGVVASCRKSGGGYAVSIATYAATP